jgi:hypothetical protein
MMPLLPGFLKGRWIHCCRHKSIRDRRNWTLTQNPDERYQVVSLRIGRAFDKWMSTYLPSLIGAELGSGKRLNRPDPFH